MDDDVSVEILNDIIAWGIPGKSLLCRLICHPYVHLQTIVSIIKHHSVVLQIYPRRLDWTMGPNRRTDHTMLTYLASLPERNRNSIFNNKYGYN